jgi:Ca2+:H+ antiporter
MTADRLPAPPPWRTPSNWLLLAAPAAVALHLLGGQEVWLFVCSALAIVRLAGLMGRATEELAEALGPSVGGLLNATFGNAAELIIALMALSKGPHMHRLVKASLTGSIIGNVLLVLGMAILAGGLYHKRQVFNRTAAGMGATLLALASIGLLMPTLYHEVFRSAARLTAEERHNIENLSMEIAVILALLYVLSLVFSLKTHQHLFGVPEEQLKTAGRRRPVRMRSALLLLLAATAGVALMSEFLVGSSRRRGGRWGWARCSSASSSWRSSATRRSTPRR